jgi:crossover junction endodeoxyribonuclease RuvC
MRAIGVDPGLSATGYGVIEGDGLSAYTCVTHGCIRTSPKKSIGFRLSHIYNGLLKIIDQNAPFAAAGVEKIFVGKDPKSHLHLGEARGVIFLALQEKGLDICEFSALQVKKNLTGYGGAHKDQVFYMISRLLGIEGNIDHNASDALAVAMCVLNHTRVSNLRRLS